MIIIIGKEDKKRLFDCACYISECGDYYRGLAKTTGRPSSYLPIAQDCWRLSGWLRKIAKVNIFKKH